VPCGSQRRQPDSKPAASETMPVKSNIRASGRIQRRVGTGGGDSQ
jgi:hypothetical protein